MDGRDAGGALQHHAGGHVGGFHVANLVDRDEIDVVPGGNAAQFFPVFLPGAFNGQLQLDEVLLFHFHLVGYFDVFLQRRAGLHDRSLGGGFAGVDRADNQRDPLVGGGLFDDAPLFVLVAQRVDRRDVIHVAQADGHAALVGDFGVAVGNPAQPFLLLVVEYEASVLGHVGRTERLVHVDVPNRRDDLDALGLVETLADGQPAKDALVNPGLPVDDFQVYVGGFFFDGVDEQLVDLVGAFPGLLLQGRFPVFADEGFEHGTGGLTDDRILFQHVAGGFNQLFGGQGFMFVLILAGDTDEAAFLGDKRRSFPVDSLHFL